MQTYSENDIINSLQKVGDRVDCRVSKSVYEKYKDDNFPSTATIKRHIGTWDKAKQKAGLKLYEPTKKDCITALKDVDSRFDIIMTQDMYRNTRSDKQPSLCTIKRLFDSWNKAKEDANLEIHTKYTKEECINALQEVDNRISRYMTIQDYPKLRDSTHPSKSTIKRRFDGSWIQAKKEAELEILNRNPYSVLEYGSRWDTKREMILYRDNYHCCMCGCTQSEHYNKYNQDLHIHHIQKFKTYLDSFSNNELKRIEEGNASDELLSRVKKKVQKANKPFNLITLCKECHMNSESLDISTQKQMYTDSVLYDSSNLTP